MSLAEVSEAVAAAAARADREPDEITIVAVSKSHPAEAVAALYEQGHRDFGENRAQELATKAAVLPADIRWHFIGPLQRNKVRLVRPVATLLHSMDRPALARAWMADGADPPPALLQVNIGGEQQKSGVEPAEALAAFEQMQAIGVRLAGLMAMPPLEAAGEQARPYFAALRALREELADAGHTGLELSMGMTNDYEVAIEEGSTLIRVGRAIFGPRPTTSEA